MPQRTTFTDTERAFIAQMRVGHLATSNEDGEPHIIPVCYGYAEPHFYIALDEKPKRVPVTQLRRVRNIESRHRAILLIDQYQDDWSRIGYLQIYSHAAIASSDDPRHPLALRILRERYTQYQQMALEQAPMIVLTPYRITSWGPLFTQDIKSQ